MLRLVLFNITLIREQLSSSTLWFVFFTVSLVQLVVQSHDVPHLQPNNRVLLDCCINDNLFFLTTSRTLLHVLPSFGCWCSSLRTSAINFNRNSYSDPLTEIVWSCNLSFDSDVYFFFVDVAPMEGCCSECLAFLLNLNSFRRRFKLSGTFTAFSW